MYVYTHIHITFLELLNKKKTQIRLHYKQEYHKTQIISKGSFEDFKKIRCTMHFYM